MTTLWLVDNSLRGTAGHPLEYARVVAEEAQRRGIETRILAHASIAPDIAPELAIEPAIRHMFFDRFNSEGLLLRLGRIGIAADYLRANTEFARDLRSALSPRIQPDDVVFAPSVDHRQLSGWARWLRSLPSSKRPRSVVLMMRYNLRDGLDHRINPHRKMIARGLGAIKKLVRAGYPIRMATDSERLAAEYAEYVPGLTFEIFPIPHTARAAADVKQAQRQESDLVKFVAVGDARLEKGYDLIAAAIRALATFAPSDGLRGMEFALQCPITHAMNEGLHAELDELRALNLPNVRLIEEILTSDGYAELMASADIVLLPYRKQQYDARTSGPLAEALAAAKPVIVTQDTWLGEQIERGRGAGIAVRDGDIVGLGVALQQARDSINTLQHEAAERQAEWVAFHNPAAFMDNLLAS